MIYPGNFYGGREPQPLIHAIGHLHASGKVQPGDLKLILMGDGSDQFAPLLQETRTSPYVDLLPRLPYRQALEIISQADLGLNLYGEVDRFLSATKLFDFAYMDKPVVTLGPFKSETAYDDFKDSSAVCLDSNSPEQVEQTLLRLIEEVKAGKMPPPLDMPHLKQAQATRRSQTELLASIFDSITVR